MPSDPPTAAEIAAAEKIEAAKIKRVDDMSALAGTAWVSLLGALAFVAVTLLSIEDADLLLDSRMIALPLVGTDVPTRLFLGLTPIALCALYVHLHLHLTKLWHAVGYAPEDRLGWRLADNIKPWLVNDYALTLKHGTNPRDRKRNKLRKLLTEVSCWWATPLVLAWMWCKSLLVREVWVSLVILVCMAIVLGMGAHTWLAARRELADPDARRQGGVWNGLTATIAAVLLVGGYVTLAAFRTDLPGAAALARPLDIDHVDVAGVGGSLAPSAIHREEYRQKWCESAELRLDLCAKPPSDTDLATNGLIVARQRHCLDEKLAPGLDSYRKCRAYFAGFDERFERDWLDVREHALSAITRVDLRAMRLAGMSAEGATLTRVSFEGSDLSRSHMPRATLEDATLRQAVVADAQFVEANLQLADLTGLRGAGVHLGSARLAGAVLQRADLTGAILRSADLTDADLSGADLTNADLRWARLTRARFDGVILAGARLEGAIGLTQDQLNQAVGNNGSELGASTVLDDTGDFPSDWYKVPDCWVDLPEVVRHLQAKIAVEDPEDSGRFSAAFAGYVCDERRPALVGKPVGRWRSLEDSQIDARRRDALPWPPGSAREEPIPAMPWLLSTADMTP
jgi:uncharacterized protein YjbI with pentapeptide repeats